MTKRPAQKPAWVGVKAIIRAETTIIALPVIMRKISKYSYSWFLYNFLFVAYVIKEPYLATLTKHREQL